MARVSVGMPVYNGARTFERALAAVLAQTLRDIEVIVSDNASTDATAGIARRHAAADARIRYLRQDPPVAPYDNFRLVLGEARAPYFAWASADDRMRPELLERASAVLDARPDVVACVPRVEFVDAAGTTTAAAGTFALMGTVRDNVAAFLGRPADNSRFYGVFRREPLLSAMPAQDFYAADWATSLATLLHGKHAELPDVLLVREANATAKYLDLIDAHYAGRAVRYFALWPFTRYVRRRLRPPMSARAWWRLLRLNLWAHLAYCRRRHPWYGAPAFGLAAVADRVLGNAAAGAPRGRG